MPSFDLNDYVTVAERLDLFRTEHPFFGLLSEVLVDSDNRLVVKATVTDDSGRVLAVGHAEEIRGSNPVNKTSALENAETSAWGRALANLGYEVKKGVASREEMEKVERMAPTRGALAETQPPSPPKPKNWAIPKMVKELGLTDPTYRGLLAFFSDGLTSSKDLDDNQAGRIVNFLLKLKNYPEATLATFNKQNKGLAFSIEQDMRAQL